MRWKNDSQKAPTPSANTTQRSVERLWLVMVEIRL